MKIVAINTVDYGSTGKIMLGIAGYAREKGYEYETFSVARRNKNIPVNNHRYYLSYFGYLVHYILGKTTGMNGFFSVFPTIRLVRALRKIKPDIIHLHNIHGFCINIPILFSFLKKHRPQVVWTLHDCWTMTGHCVHYEMNGCIKWQTGCSQCPYYKEYPESLVDNSRIMWRLKKKWFSNIPNLTIVTPSCWLEAQVRNSYLHNCNIKTIHNGVKTEIFRPIDSDFRRKYSLDKKYVILGVAFGWGKKKGLDVFLELSQKLPENYKIVLVGTSEQIDKLLLPNIISIHRTSDQQELAGIYSAADVFVNPTREDTFPTVNIESLACGTPVITFATGGSPEIPDETCGYIVEKDNITMLEEKIIEICENEPFSREQCVQRAEVFREENSYFNYISLYEEINSHNKQNNCQEQKRK